MLLPAVGGLVTGVTALAYPEVLYQGFGNVDAVLDVQGQPNSAWLLSQIVVAKVFATAVCRGSGLVGGLYAPSIFTGAWLLWLQHFAPPCRPPSARDVSHTVMPCACCLQKYATRQCHICQHHAFVAKANLHLRMVNAGYSHALLAISVCTGSLMHTAHLLQNLAGAALGSAFGSVAQNVGAVTGIGVVEPQAYALVGVAAMLAGTCQVGHITVCGRTSLADVNLLLAYGPRLCMGPRIQVFMFCAMQICMLLLLIGCFKQ